jgi:hypothetical protein
MNEVAEIAFTIARTRAPALEKLEELLTAVHHHNKMTLLKEKHMHDLIVAAMQENWAVIKAHIEQMVTICRPARADSLYPKSSRQVGTKQPGRMQVL